MVLVIKQLQRRAGVRGGPGFLVHPVHDCRAAAAWQTPLERQREVRKLSRLIRSTLGPVAMARSTLPSTLQAAGGNCSWGIAAPLRSGEFALHTPMLPQENAA